MARHAPRHRTPLRALLACLLVVPAAAALAPVGAQAADPAPAQVYQAEDGTLNGVTVSSEAPGYQGTGYVEGFDADTDSVTIAVPDNPGGLFALSVRYRAPYGDKKTSLLVNGSGLGEVALPDTAGAFADAAAGKVLLRAGANTVTLRNDWGWYDIDSVSLTPVPPRAPHAVTGELSDPEATPEAHGLMDYLTAHYGKDLISGQQDTASERWVENTTGRAPAIEGLDLIDYSPSRVEHGTTSQETENALAWDARGGMVSMVWHWNAPSHLIDEPGKEWWRGFYTDSTTFDLAAALADPSSEDYRLLLRDIDAIAVQLKRLQDAGVPVLWRPLHEAEGGWFWWGAKGPGPAKELYRLMYDRLTGLHRLHNLVWVWNSVDPAWYPGDDVVDVVSADSYPTAGDHGPVALTYDRLLSLTGDTKPVALAEVGTIPDPELTRAYQADWSYFVTWSGSFVDDGASNPADFLTRVYHDPHVITLDELGDFKHNGGGGADTTAPGAPTGLTATPAATSVVLSWTASTDNVGVTGYDVYRDGTRVGGGTSTTYTDTGLSAGTTYHYTVRAKDAAGNVSAPSAALTVSTPPGGGGCTATYSVTSAWGGGFTADIRVKAGAGAVRSWKVTWTYPGNQRVTGSWNATVTQSAAAVTAVNASYNGTLAAGASTSFGLQGSYTGTNSAPTPTCTAG